MAMLSNDESMARVLWRKCSNDRPGSAKDQKRSRKVEMRLKNGKVAGPEDILVEVQK